MFWLVRIELIELEFADDHLIGREEVVIPNAHVGPIAVVIVPLVLDVHALVSDQICGSDVAVALGGNNLQHLKRIEQSLQRHLKST